MSIDGIKKTKKSTECVKLTAPPKRVFKIDGISGPRRELSDIAIYSAKLVAANHVPKKPSKTSISSTKPAYTRPVKAGPEAQFQKAASGFDLKTGFKSSYRIYSGFIAGQKVNLLAAIAALFLAFGGGVWLTLSTAKTAAVDEAAQPPVNYQVLLPDAQLPSANSVGNNILFNTPIQYLKNYLATMAQPDIIEQRTQALTKYLQDQKSPLASAAATIAEQPHWQLILAIAFAESTLGKNCSDDNCSNIGVKPGAPSWRQYGSYQDWVVDFNRLLDKKYNDWTLKQMCGVYVQPCNPNWLLATQEVMDDLKSRGID